MGTGPKIPKPVLPFYVFKIAVGLVFPIGAGTDNIY